MRDWQTARIGDHIKIKHGYAFEGEGISDIDNGNILVTPGNFDIGGGFKSNKFKFYAGLIPDEYIFSAHDLVVTMTDLSKEGDTLGYPAFIPLNLKYTYLHNQRVGKVIFEDDFFDKRFLYYLLCTDEYRHEVLASATGTSIKHTSPKRIEQFSAIVPLSTEQKAIAAVLGALDDKIELNRRMNAKLEAMARALFKSWFVDFDPVRAKMAGKQPFGMDAATAALFPSRLTPSSLGDIPEGWEVKPLDQIADFLNGLALQKFPAVGSDFLPVIKIAQIRQGNSAGADRASVNIPKNYVINDGDIIFSWSGSLMQVLWTGGKGALNQHLFKVTSEKYPKWLYALWVDEYMPWFRSIAASKATTMGHIQRMHLSQALGLAPPEELIKKMDGFFAPLFEKRLEIGIQNNRLENMRDYLLPKLISGDIRIPDAEKFMEAAA